MTAQVATIACGSGILALFALDRDRNAKNSNALWLPVIWVAIAASRMVSQWLAGTGFANFGGNTVSTDQLLEGSPLDRWLLTLLVAAGVIVLVTRARPVATILSANAPVLLFFLYCLVSIYWSDFPAVAFKRWIKALGDLTMILIVLTEREPNIAVRRLICRVGFLLIPLSILLAKYYPYLGRVYYSHLGTFLNVGVATGKNELGIVCFLFGAGSFWRFVQALRGTDAHRTSHLIAHGVVLAATVWLFKMAQSLTSLACFLMAISIIFVTSLRSSPAHQGVYFRTSAVEQFAIAALRVVRAPVVKHLLVAALLFSSAAVLFLHVGSGLMETMGRDATLTGRTGVWQVVLDRKGNAFFGTGFESFWLGPRLEEIWRIFWWHPNEAHNGYLELFLNLGLVGITLLALVLFAGYRDIVRTFRRDPDTGSVRLAYFVTALAYNFTESAIRIMHPVWIFFLLSAIAVPGGWKRNPATRTVTTYESPVEAGEGTGSPAEFSAAAYR